MDGFSEILKWIIEGGSAGTAVLLAYVLFKKFMKKEVIEAIAELREKLRHMEKDSQKSHDMIATTMSTVTLKSHEVQNNVSAALLKMNENFNDMAKYSGKALMDSQQNSMDIKKVESQTDGQIEKLAAATHKVLVKFKSTETEVVKLGKDMIYIKDKVDKK